MRKKIVIQPFLRSPIILLLGYKFLAHRLATKKLETPIAPRSTLKLSLFSPKTLFNYTKKNSNFAVFKIANNFIIGIQFLAHRLAPKNWKPSMHFGTLLNYPDLLQKPYLIIRRKILISPFLRSLIILLLEYNV